jgi:LysM repeat protein
MHEAGLFQRVGGIKPGTTLRFSIAMEAWMCFEINKCGKDGIYSDWPTNMHLRVGIDPYGGTDPFSPNIVWSPEQDAFDRWVEFSVQAKALGDTVTVFTHSRPDWDWARKNNDVYLDDASLVVVTPTATALAVSKPVARPSTSKPAAQPIVSYSMVTTDSELNAILNVWAMAAAITAKSGTPTTSITSTVSVTSTANITSTASVTPPSSGAPRIHQVVVGDTLALLAAHYNTTIQAIVQANNITNTDLIFIGQNLIIP